MYVPIVYKESGKVDILNNIRGVNLCTYLVEKNDDIGCESVFDVFTHFKHQNWFRLTEFKHACNEHVNRIYV